MQCKSEKANEYLCPFKVGGCQGCACMAWTWVKVKDPDYIPSDAKLTCFLPAPMIETDIGYCGLVK